MAAVFGITQGDWFARVNAQRPRRAHFWLPTPSQPRRIELGERWYFREAGGTRILGFGIYAGYEVTTPRALMDCYGIETGYVDIDDLAAGLGVIGKPAASFDVDRRIGNVMLDEVSILPSPITPPVPLRAYGGTFDYFDDSDLRGLLPRTKGGEERIVLPSDVPPTRREYARELFVRNRKHVQDLKHRYGGRCQVTGEVPLAGLAGADITEVHHIDWLTHGGLDVPSNMLVVSPDLHAAIHANASSFEWSSLTLIINGHRLSLTLNHHLKTRP
jgi:hypothetical protein